MTAKLGTPYSTYENALAGMAIQFMLFIGIDVVLGMLQFRSAVKPGGECDAGGDVDIGDGVRLCAHWFGVKVEWSFAGFIAMCAPFSLMTAAYGMLIASLGNTPGAARGLATLFRLS